MIIFVYVYANSENKKLTQRNTALDRDRDLLISTLGAVIEKLGIPLDTDTSDDGKTPGDVLVNCINRRDIERKIEELITLRSELGCLDTRDANKIAIPLNQRIDALKSELEQLPTVTPDDQALALQRQYDNLKKQEGTEHFLRLVKNKQFLSSPALQWLDDVARQFENKLHSRKPHDAQQKTD